MSEHVTPSDFVHDLKPYPYVPEAREKQRIIDPVGVMLSREQRGREQIIAQEMVKIVREEITKCYQREGTNHYQNCKHLTKQRVAGAVRRARRGPARRRGTRSTPPPQVLRLDHRARFWHAPTKQGVSARARARLNPGETRGLALVVRRGKRPALRSRRARRRRCRRTPRRRLGPRRERGRRRPPRRRERRARRLGVPG